MADNLLGVLFVTSSPRGRTIFRYPPDPLSPIPRLAQPIYPKSTYTATDGVPDHHLSSHHGRARRPPPVDVNRSSGGTLKPAQVKDKDRDELALSSEDDTGKSTGDDAEEPTPQTYYLSDRDDDSIDSSEDDSDGLWTPLGAQARTSPKAAKKDFRSVSGANAPQTSNSDPTSGTGTPMKPANEPASLLSAQVERSKLGLSQSHLASSLPASPTTGPELAHYKKHAHHPPLDVFTPRSYTHALSYPLGFLSDLLTPRRVECNKKFELIVDELAFIGHPVSVGPDGKWEIPKGDEEEEEVQAMDPLPVRGRAGRRDGKPTNASSGLGTVVEGQQTPSSDRESKDKPSDNETSPAPTLEVFHLVLILDRPDPTAEAQLLENGRKRKGAYDEIYAQVAFKWTAAAWELQCRSGWIARETEKIVSIREDCFQRRVPIVNCLQSVLKASSLARSLSALFNGLHHHALHPPSQLTSLPTTLSIPVADHFLTIHLSARPEDATAEAWTQWGNSEDGMESQSSDDEGSVGWDSMEEEDEWNEMLIQGRRNKGRGISKEVNVEPWKTLLPLEDELTVKQRKEEALEDLAGLGIVFPGTRQNSVEMEKAAAVGEDAVLRRTFVSALDVSKPLFDIADSLMYDLETVVLPLARDLIYSRKARLIDVVTPRFRGVFMPTTVAKRSTSIAGYSARFNQMFPTLPPFPAFMAKLSASPQPFKAMLPSHASSELRQTYLDCLLWLLREDLLVQVHMRVRIFARREVKIEAWRRAWLRGREKWLKKEQRQRVTDMETPTAESYASIPPPMGMEDRRGSVITLGDLSDLELDSDREDEYAGGETPGFSYSLGEEKPPLPPKFEDSFIFKPARALKEETRWLRVIKDAQDEVWASKFDLCLQYFDGSTTPDEILYRTGMHRRDFDKILKLFEKDLITFLHP